MKQFFSIVTALVFLFEGAGYYLAFTLAHKQAKNEMAQVIRSFDHNHTVIQLYISKSELNKEVRFTKADQMEFIYRGQHYDVIKRQDEGDKISITCIADKKETMLISALGKKLSEQSSGNNTSAKTSAKSLMHDWFFQIQSSELPAETSVLFSSCKVFFLSDILSRIPSPPPKG